MSSAPARLLRFTAKAGGHSLVQVVGRLLRDAFPDLPISSADARRTVVAGAARVNARPLTRPGAPIREGDRITVRVLPGRLARTRRAPVPAIEILYRDEHVIVANKPAGLPTHATADPDRPHLVGLVARCCGVDEAALGVHQRLDAGTSGVVVFGRTPTANRALARAFEARAVEKVYLAVVHARRRPDLTPGHTWTSRVTIGRGGTGRRGRRALADAGGEEAETAFSVRARSGDLVVVEARPRTGRYHQIRAHLAAESVPIVGDSRYGGPPADRLALHAWRLRFPHPVHGLPDDVEAPPPEGWLEGRVSGTGPLAPPPRAAPSGRGHARS